MGDEIKHEVLAPLALESDLHVHTLAPCPNTILLDAVRRSQRVLIATHSAFANYQLRDEIARMAAEHILIYEALADGDIEHAAQLQTFSRSGLKHVRGPSGIAPRELE